MRFGCGRLLRVLNVIGLIGLLGCSESTPGKNRIAAPPFRGQEVDLVVPKSMNLQAIWEVMIQEWSSQSGATAQFRPYDDTVENIEKSFPEANSGGSFVLFPLNRICEVDKSLTSLVSKDGLLDARDIFKGLRERILSRDRQMVACPISVPVIVCYYRSDLLRAANRVAPETWDDYLDLVETVDRWAPGLAAVEPLSPEFRATTFFARSLSFCKHPENYSVWFDVDTGKPTLNTPGFEKALDIAEQTWKRLSPESLKYSPAECRQLVLTGKAAITLSFESSEAELSTKIEQDNATNLQRVDGIKVGICRLPGSRTVFNRNSKKWDAMPNKSVHAPAFCGFAGLIAGVILPENHSDDSAAINLLASLTSPAEFDRAFATLPKNPCRESQLVQAAHWYGPELSSEEASQYCDAVAQSLRDTQVVFELPVNGADEFRKAVSTALEPLLRGEMSSRQALDAMQLAFETIVERLGADVVRDSYRRGLGMSASLKK
jgi:ABC-type glycerol-3-phosphate transport system substrate-binding protein